MIRTFLACVFSVSAAAAAAPVCPPGQSARRGSSGVVCSACGPAGAVSAADEEGWTTCVGGDAGAAWCPPGTGTVILHRVGIKAWFCLPCPDKTLSVQYSAAGTGAWRECVPLRCAEGEVPIRRAGPVRDYTCVKPLNGQASSASRALPAGTGGWTGAVPACGSGQGLELDPASGAFECRRCAPGESVLRRLGSPVCGFAEPGPRLRWTDPCGAKKVPLHDGRCVPCPKGSRLTEEVEGQPQCLPSANP
ncbi:MAG: hypothetical protein KGJ84_10960 [Elusimicrobia bacterium]|nr:hypothetical protein [Elusimicrobiota bacterium]